MKDDKIVLYMHAGSGNHGCEAIVNSLCRMLPKPAILMTNRPKEDETYSLKELCSSFVQEKSIEKNVLVHTWYYLKRKLFHDPDCFMEYRYQDICGKNLHRLNISIGGDNYCYDNMLDRLISANRMFHKQGAKTVLYGCSIEPELLKRPEIMEDMKRYDAIVARESLTFAALQEAGIDKNIHLYPDSAFLLETKLAPLPEGWVPGKMLGLNISPMIVDNEKTPGITMQNYKALISHILETTDLHIALIPHVVWESNDDRKPIRQLYEAFASTGAAGWVRSGIKGLYQPLRDVYRSPDPCDNRGIFLLRADAGSRLFDQGPWNRKGFIWNGRGLCPAGAGTRPKRRPRQRI